ncbi:aminoglycoside adenylyltransferase [Gracilibacillus salitolerans]|uniref:Aminoglycoside adenylyltransferase n=1 Tax=Gracilibacillus salitolerans TaxID=2663022 RepID=A0A5Q2TG34_9BACI|nr:aminoglycoside 6-adenylyltransferase [Gracilibacillus salitolerans]QGH32890.1 aminoglycoside adenylyltransferase [Gracilibacillus salitolerans]
MAHLTYDKIMERFLSFVEKEQNIRAVIIVGSRARQDKPADQYSDLDLVIFAENPNLLLDHKEWLAQIGKSYITFLENTAVGGGMERRVLFEGGLDVDFASFPISAISEMESQDQVLSVLSKGVEVLIDKDNSIPSLKKHIKTDFSKNEIPEDIENTMQDFWYHAVLAAKKLCRGELLEGKSICDSYMKNLLISFIRTHAKLKNGIEFNTWHGFRFFEEWADPAVVRKFKKIYAHYEEEDVWKALIHTMKLFNEVTIEVCKLKNLPYPDENIRYATHLVESYYLQGRQEKNE